MICGWVGLNDRISLHQGSALSMPFADGAFDGAYMLHVGMNIEDKVKLCSEVHRVLRPGSLFGIYDVMKAGAGELSYPVPWATTPASSFVADPAQYRSALQAAGFAVIAELNRRDFAITFFDQFRAKTMAAGGPPPLGHTRKEIHMRSRRVEGRQANTRGELDDARRSAALVLWVRGCFSSLARPPR